MVISFWKHPLFHFMVLGAFLFILYGALHRNDSDRDEIRIDDDIVLRSMSLFEKEWGRKPTRPELKGLLDRYIQQEVFYRQALKMNLDHNDELIKRRMEQKLKFITQDLATLQDPSEDELKKWYAVRKDKYRLPMQVSFTQLYFNPDNRADVLSDAQLFKTKIGSSSPNDPGFQWKADPFSVGERWKDQSIRDIALQMGQPFADSLMKAPLNQWYGPILSGYGVHLVYLSAKTPGGEAPWSRIEATVLRDYQYEASEKMNDQVYQEFLKEYTIQYRLKDKALIAQSLEKP